MEYDTERAAQKAFEVQQITENAVILLWRTTGVTYSSSDAEAIAKKLVASFVEITPPEAEARVMELILLTSGGRGGGRSVKPGNLYLNMRKLFTAIASGVLTMASVIGAPWTAPFAALVLWNEVWSGLQVNISEREAVVLWTMWDIRDLNNYVSEDGLLEKVNSVLEANGRPRISKEELNDSLTTLARMSCIERAASIANKWWLCEWIQKNYS